MSPAEYRERARECRDLAAKDGPRAGEYLIAAASWEQLAEQAERSAEAAGFRLGIRVDP